jgi:glutathione S-transferase
MKLYASPGACSLSPHIALREAGLNFDLVKVDTRAHKLAGDGSDFYAVNENGYVPVLELDGGERLTEGPAIVQYIADQAPDKHLAPPNGTLPRYHQQEWLSFITSELHKGFSPLFRPETPDVVKESARDKLAKRFKYVEHKLGDKAYLMGDAFTVADGYLFTMLTWCGPYTGVLLDAFPKLVEYRDRVKARPAVAAALAAEAALRS